MGLISNSSKGKALRAVTWCRPWRRLETLTTLVTLTIIIQTTPIKTLVAWGIATTLLKTSDHSGLQERNQKQRRTFGANLRQYALLQSWARNWWTHPRDQVIGVHPIRSFTKNKHQLWCCKKKLNYCDFAGRSKPALEAASSRRDPCWQKRTEGMSTSRPRWGTHYAQPKKICDQSHLTQGNCWCTACFSSHWQ